MGPTLTQASAALPRPGLAPEPHLRGHWCPVAWRLSEVREGRLSTGDARAARMAGPNCALAEPGQFFLVLPGRGTSFIDLCLTRVCVFCANPWTLQS